VPYDYPVYFTRRLFDPANPLLREALARREQRRHRVLVCVDAGVARAMPGLLASIRRYFRAQPACAALAGPIELVRGGEQSKNSLQTASRVIRWIERRRLCRQSFVMVVGGGSVLDVVGFAASLVHRGIRLVRVPTTVVAQNDVGVGVKTGLDAFGAKNFLGTFAPPFAVLNDFTFLDALPQRDWVAGIAEAFKVAMIKDRAFFHWLCNHAAGLAARDRAAMERLVRRCARLHLDHIRAGGDPFEMGSARPLDFGHWSAHQLEVLSGYAMKHGEAVAIGLALDAYYAMRRGLLSARELNALLQGLRDSGLRIWSPLLETKTRRGTLAVLEGLERFREHLGGVLTVTLPRSIGRKTEVHAMDRRVLAEGIVFLRGVEQPSVVRNAATRRPRRARQRV
jgi:3-dehydroquinate synthase